MYNAQKETKRQRHMACLSKTISETLPKFLNFLCEIHPTSKFISTILNKLLQKCRKRLMKSKKLDGLKKQREILLSKLDQLGTALQTNDVDKFLKFPRFQAILDEIDEELPYIEKHIDRMESANAIKRAFIKKNVCKKFKEISERISNISRSINVFQVNESSEFSSVEQDIKDVQSQMDKLAGDIKENGSRRDLDQAIRQPPKAKKSKPAVPSEEHKSVDSIDELESPNSQGAKAEQLLQDGH